ncbi:MAG: hypothetical protein KatS3mg003_0744 [Candidatus Nitrosocaldaceae archaeon]|nr:MAG: hypothetical protein KatS3mg003_0744 [Candidatus Nitrosocaldaceae archaeon]
MPRKGWKTTLLREEVYNKLSELHRIKNKQGKESRSFAGWLNDYLLEIIEEHELLSRKAPALEFLDIASDGSIAIKDHFEDRIVEVEPHGDKRILYCRYCERDNCLHVGFCFAIREVHEELRNRGFKLPRDIA